MSENPKHLNHHFWKFVGVLAIGIIAFFGEALYTHGALSLEGYDQGQNLLNRELGTNMDLSPFKFAYQDTAPWQCLGPADRFAIKQIRSGQAPLWSPNIAMGWPVFASGSAAPFSPFKIPIYLWPNHLGMNLYMLLKVLAAGIFTYLFLRRLRRSIMAAAFGAVGYAFCGYTISYLPFHHDPVALLPLLLFLGESLLRRPGIFQALCLGAAGAATLYSGHITVAVMTLLATGYYLLVRRSLGAWTEKGFLRGCSFAAIICLLLSAPMTLPMAEFLHNGWSYKNDQAREVDESKTEREFPFGARRFANTVLPHFGDAFRGEERIPGGAGLFRTDSQTGERRFRSFLYAYMGYLGALTWALALFYLLWRPHAPSTTGMHQPRRTLVLFLFPAIFIAFALPGSAYLKYIPIVGDILPRYFLAWCAFAFLVIAAHGFDALVHQSGSTRKFAFAGGLYSVLALTLSAVYGGQSEAGGAGYGSVFQLLFWPLITLWSAWVALWLHRRGTIPRKVLALLFCLLLYGDFYVQGSWIPGAPIPHKLKTEAVAEFMGESFRPEDRVAGLGDSMWPNTSIHAGLNDVQGILPLFVSRYRAFMEVAEPSLKDLYPTSSRIREPNEFFNLASVSRYLIPAQWQYGANDKNIVYEGKALRVVAKEAMPRAYIVYSLAPARDMKSAVAKLRESPHSAATTPIVEANSEATATALKPFVLAKPDTEYTPATITSYRPDEVLISLKTERAGVLVLTDIYYPGWRAVIDGKKGDIVPINVAFRGVVVPAGAQNVRIFYEPGSLRFGLWLLLAGLLLAISTFLPRKNKPTRSNEKHQMLRD